MRVLDQDEPNSVDPDSVHHIADAITWLSLVATTAGYQSVGRELLQARDSLRMIAIDGSTARQH